ncbi:YolD-like family protein [Alicyclobacillus mali]|uniref:YolD-like family protein n=1 Tax=Alicyclobacillus mali (ex Roth et al. 2021) TaxID=1123961 RepID=A0ABS0EZM0_9BACL|nr:YolD-like family protein [Alicyclobacillus mali (ex Roth et al. 2021)]MBF8376471.1 YolD-like family protein [Alicyclobacillus mali (ex Roth et al. 2021)]
MNIRDGNIFEAMRLVLPEHRALMAQIQRERMKRKRPVLTEERLEEIQYTLSEAILEGNAVRVTVFTPERDVVLMGHVSVSGRELRVCTAAGVHIVDVRDVVGVEMERS